MKKLLTISTPVFCRSKALLILFILVSIYSVQAARACTIFVLTDENKTLFFNNEDYSNPNTKIWFAPAGTDYYGCVYVGFDNGVAQGGMNTEGLAFDWFAGGKVNYSPGENMVPAKGSSPKRMLETCATVEEAIQFYKTYAEPGFGASTILIADKSGRSVIIGASNGRLYFKPSNGSRALGYGNSIFDRMYGKETPIELASGLEILKACVQDGEYGTKYSNVFDLKTGDISLYQFPENSQSTDLNLFTKLEKGAHYYDIPEIKSQITKPPMSLSLNMHRLILFEFEDNSDQEQEATAKAKTMILDGANGTMQAEDYSEEFWAEVKKEQGKIQSDLTQIGEMKSIHLVHKAKQKELSVFSYVIVFENARILMEFAFDRSLRAHNLEAKRIHISNMDLFRQSGSFGNSNWMKIGLPVIGVVLIAVLIFMFARRKKRMALAVDN